MRKFVALIGLLLSCTLAMGQEADSLFVVQFKDGWVISHKLKGGENVYSLARQYHVPPMMLAEFNNISFQQDLNTMERLFIPIGAYNLWKDKATLPPGSRPLYHKVRKPSSLRQFAQLSGISSKTLQHWNNLSVSDVDKGQLLLVGWLIHDAPGTNGNRNKQIIPEVVPERGAPVAEEPDTIIVLRDTPLDTLSEGEKQYLKQTGDGVYAVHEKGTAAFFKGGGSSDDIYFAFHDTAPRGTIIKVTNPGTQKTVYVKVIGKVPSTRLYHNAIIGISSAARAALEVYEEKAWCELSYKQN